MKLIKITKIEKALFQIEYRNFWGSKKTKKIYPYLHSWRWSETGEEVPYFISTSIGSIARELAINETKYFTPQ